MHRLLFAVLSTLTLLAPAGCAEDASPTPGSDLGITAIDAGATALVPFVVQLETTAGTFSIAVDPSWAPIGAARFRELVEGGFYQGNRFFRVVAGFVVQFGLNGDPAVNEKWRAKTIADDPVLESNTRGRVTFAKTSSPNSRTTQLFINLSANTSLDSQGFAPFGEVVEGGMGAVDAINDEYGEKPSQTQILSQGNSYLDANFPKLDYVVSARIQ